MYHDLSDEYKSRDYLVAITLQEGDYFGNIYYEYNCNGYGLMCNIMEDILQYIKALDCEQIDEYNAEGLLNNDIRLKADINGEYIHFVLRNNNEDLLEKCIPYSKLQNYIVGYNMIKCDGRGNKKERRRCVSCENFSEIEGSAKGNCLVRKDKVQRSRIICSYDYVEKQ
ncbi:MAG: hypothetical protein KID00_05580 [Clostridium argentinense]|uniref:hypothetical protein n=1 Tax=Clostridium butanoliproducens TaxID=2991837 RepID=UPI001DC8F9DB|nr:hypothetical protein [Clostridium butanoliproducens]MBS5823320.1 hypothetical protein [Clostridium argentinense]